MKIGLLKLICLGYRRVGFGSVIYNVVGFLWLKGICMLIKGMEFKYVVVMIMVFLFYFLIKFE